MMSKNTSLQKVRLRVAKIQTRLQGTWQRLLRVTPRTLWASCMRLLRGALKNIANHFGLYSLMAVFITLGIALGTQRFNYLLDGFDYSVFNQAVWQLSHGEIPQSTIRAVHYTWGDHFHPIIILLAPIYAIFNSARTLYVVQAFLFASALIPIYLFGLRKLKNKLLTLLICAAFIFYGAVQYALFFDFHEIAFAMPLLGFAIYFFDRNKWTSFYWMMALLLLTKEDLALIIIVFGVIAILFKHQFKRGFLIMGIGFAWFAALYALVIPKLAGGVSTFNYWASNYSEFGATPAKAVLHTALHPASTMKIAFTELFDSHQKIQTILYMLKPFLLVFVFISPYVLLALPNIALRFWGNATTYWDYHFHYGAVLSIILFMAFIDSLSRVIAFTSRYGKTAAEFGKNIVSLVVIFSLLYSIRGTYFPGAPYGIINRSAFSTSGTTIDKLHVSKILAMVPHDASVTVVETLAPLVTNRDHAYILYAPNQWDVRGNLFLAKTPNTQFIVYNSKLASVDPKYKDAPALLSRIQSLGYSVSYSDNDGWVIFKK